MKTIDSLKDERDEAEAESARLRAAINVLAERQAEVIAERDALREALMALLDVSERDRAGYAVEIEVWYAARDYARSALALTESIS